MRIASVGHAVFAAAFIGLGILGLVKSEYAQVWDGVPKAFPGRELLPTLCALVSLGCGLGLLWQRTAAAAARVLLAYLVVWAMLFKLPFILRYPLVEGSYQTTGENTVEIAAAWVLFAWFATDWDRRQIGFATGERGVRIARVLYALAMIAFGLSHYAYLQLTAPIIPDWIPWHVFWAYFTGAAYLAAAAGMLTGVWARLAATLSAVQMGGFTLLVWVPMMLTGHISAFQWGEFTVSTVLTAGGWVVADSYRGVSWFAVGRRSGFKPDERP